MYLPPLPRIFFRGRKGGLIEYHSTGKTDVPPLLPWVHFLWSVVRVDAKFSKWHAALHASLHFLRARWGTSDCNVTVLHLPFFQWTPIFFLENDGDATSHKVFTTYVSNWDFNNWNHPLFSSNSDFFLKSPFPGKFNKNVAIIACFHWQGWERQSEKIKERNKEREGERKNHRQRGKMRKRKRARERERER